MNSKVLQAATLGMMASGLVSAFHFSQMMPYSTMIAFGMAAMIMFGIGSVDGLAPAVHAKALEVGASQLIGAGAGMMWVCVLFLHGMSVYTSTLSFQKGVEQRKIEERTQSTPNENMLQWEMYSLAKEGKADSDQYRKAKDQLSGDGGDEKSATASVLKSDKDVWLWSFLSALMIEAIYLACGMGRGIYRYLTDFESSSSSGDITSAPGQKAPVPKQVQPAGRKAANDLEYLKLKKPDPAKSQSGGDKSATTTPEKPTVLKPVGATGAVKQSGKGAEVVGPYSRLPTQIDVNAKATAVAMLQSMGEDKGKGRRKGHAESLVDQVAKPGMSAQDIFKAAYTKPKASTGTTTPVKPVRKSDHKFDQAYRRSLKACQMREIKEPSVRAFWPYTSNSQSLADKVAKKLCADGVIARNEKGRYCWPKSAAA